MKKQQNVIKLLKKAAKTYGSYDNFYILEKESEEAKGLLKSRKKY